MRDFYIDLHFCRLLRGNLFKNKKVRWQEGDKMRTRKQTTKRKISVINFFCAIIALYIIGSFFEVNVHNQIGADPLENPYNAFSLLSQAMSE